MKIKRLFWGRQDSDLSHYIFKTFGISPNDISLYKQALVYRSFQKKGSQKYVYNNERLEYLGDAIISAVVADFLYHKYPFEEEGFLSEMRAKMVNRKFLNSLSKTLGLDMLLNQNRKTAPEAVNGNAFEAFIGAIYLDKGYKTVKKVLIKKILKEYVDIETLSHFNINYKGTLLKWSQKYKHKIVYVTRKEFGVNKKAKHTYIVRLLINDEFISEGCDFTIKAAEQNAAMHACEILGI